MKVEFGSIDGVRFDEDIYIWALKIGFGCFDGCVRFEEIMTMKIGFGCFGWVYEV